jgi:hypothetical protein
MVAEGFRKGVCPGQPSDARPIGFEVKTFLKVKE